MSGWMVSYSVNSSGRVPSSGRIATKPQSRRNARSRMSTCSMSPGSAPRTWTGPVTKCGPGPGTQVSRACEQVGRHPRRVGVQRLAPARRKRMQGDGVAGRDRRAPAAARRRSSRAPWSRAWRGSRDASAWRLLVCPSDGDVTGEVVVVHRAAGRRARRRCRGTRPPRSRRPGSRNRDTAPRAAR